VKSRSGEAGAVPRRTTRDSRSSSAISHITSIGPVALRVGGAVTRVQRITRSASGSPLATPCWKSDGSGDCARSPSGSTTVEAAVVHRKARRVSGTGD
jgi:hypothetical protein